MKSRGPSGWMGMLAMAGMLACVLTERALGDGFRNPPDGASAMGRGGARFARAEDPVTAMQNPANLMDVERSVGVSVTTAYRKHEYTAPYGVSEETGSPWHVLPSVCTVWPLEDTRWVLGLGLSVPYGQAVEWESDGVFQYLAPHESGMRSLQVRPMVGTRLGQAVQVGVALNLVWSDLTLKQHFPWSIVSGNPMAPDSRQEFEGSGYGAGGGLGVTINLTKHQRLALTYNSPISIEYDGDFEMDNLPPAFLLPPPLGGLSGSSDFETEIEFPTVVDIGYGVAVRDDLWVEAFAEWVEHSTHDQINLDIGNNNALLVATRGTTAMSLDWDDIWVLGVGTDWRFAPDWTARVGYVHVPTPVPSDTISPSIPESDQDLIAVGFGWKRGGQALDVTYSLSLFDSRTINGNQFPPYDGRYETEQHMVFAGYSRAF